MSSLPLIRNLLSRAFKYDLREFWAVKSLYGFSTCTIIAIGNKIIHIENNIDPNELINLAGDPEMQDVNDELSVWFPDVNAPPDNSNLSEAL